MRSEEESRKQEEAAVSNAVLFNLWVFNHPSPMTAIIFVAT